MLSKCYTVSAILIDIVAVHFTDFYEFILQVIQKCSKPRIVKTILEQNESWQASNS